MSDSSVRPMSMSEVEGLMGSDQAMDVVVALLSAALYGEARERIAKLVLANLTNENPEIVNAAILSVGHCARIDGTCDVKLVAPLFRKLSVDQRFAGRLGDALDDIEMFTPLKRSDFGI